MITVLSKKRGKLITALFFTMLLLLFSNFIIPLQWTIHFHFLKVTIAFSIVAILVIARIIYKDFVKPLSEGIEIAKQMAEGNSVSEEQFKGVLGEYLLKIQQNMEEVSTFVETVGQKNTTASINSLDHTRGLGKSLIGMQHKLQELSEVEEKRNWRNSGLTEIGDILRKNQDLSTKEISFIFLKELIPYVSLNQGGVFIINDQEEPKFIELMACYAYEKKKHLEKRIEWGQGLVGQCILEGSPTYLTEIPESYLKITSGLGTSNPRCIFLVPIRYNSIIYGVLEVASFKKLDQNELGFVEMACSAFGAVIANSKVNERTRILLEASRNIADELKIKEEILRGNTEELIATQEELNRRMKQIEDESILSQSIVEAVNKTNASIELDLEGNIIEVNDMYLSLMEYKREELIGKKEKELVSNEEIENSRYDMMWESIRKGAFNSGEFKRVSKKGKELWLSGTYSPICDINGVPTKIMQLAQFTTEQKEKELELSSKIQALNQSVYSLEFNLQGIINSSNALFQKEFGYKRSELVNKPFFELLTLESKDEVHQDFLELVRDQTIVSKTLKMNTKEGKEKHFLCNFSPIKNLSGEINKILVVMLDFSEQFRLQEELKYMLSEETRKKVQLQLNSIVQGVFAQKFAEMYEVIEQKYDFSELNFLLRNQRVLPNLLVESSGKIKLINQPACDLLGLSMDLSYGKEIFDYLYFEEDEELKYFQSRVFDPGISQVALWIKDFRGKKIRLNVWLMPDYLEKDKYNNLLMLVLNVDFCDIKKVIDNDHN
jgi:PAS domain S-box-containing protein